MDRFGMNLANMSWSEINSSFAAIEGISNILALMDLARSLQATSVINETGFNQLKLMKGDRWHRLGESHLNDLLLTKLEAPSIPHFDPTAAIDHWMVKKP